MGVGESWTLTRGKNTGIWGAAAWGAPCIPLSGCGGGDPTEGREAQVLVNKDLEQFEWQVSWGVREGMGHICQLPTPWESSPYGDIFSAGLQPGPLPWGAGLGLPKACRAI